MANTLDTIKVVNKDGTEYEFSGTKTLKAETLDINLGLNEKWIAPVDCILNERITGEMPSYSTPVVAISGVGHWLPKGCVITGRTAAERTHLVSYIYRLKHHRAHICSPLFKEVA